MRNTFLNPSKGVEWLVTCDKATNDVHKVLKHHGYTTSAKILIPGVGKSRIGLKLYKLGYKHLTLVDVEEDALAVDAARIMEKNKIFTLVVMKKNKNVGVISMHDLIQARIL